MSAEKRPYPAIAAWRRRQLLRREYLRLYDGHAPFKEAIRALYSTHFQDSAWVVRNVPTFLSLRYIYASHQSYGDATVRKWLDGYIPELRDLAEGFGLDRFLPDPLGHTGCSFGIELAHHWCRAKAEFLERQATADIKGRDGSRQPSSYADNDGPLNPDLFGDLISTYAPPNYYDRQEWIDAPGYGQLLPTFGETPKGGDESAPRRFTVESLQPAPAKFHVDADITWDVTAATRGEARETAIAAITQRIDEELDRAEAAAKRQGFVFPDTRTKTTTHLQWLFEHVVSGTRVGEISRQAGKPLSSVSHRIREYADLIGVAVKVPF